MRTIEELRRLEELEAKATPGPWKLDRREYVVEDSDGHNVAQTNGLRVVRDAEFIAEARNAFPALLSMAKEYLRLRSQVCVLVREDLLEMPSPYGSATIDADFGDESALAGTRALAESVGWQDPTAERQVSGG